MNERVDEERSRLFSGGSVDFTAGKIGQVTHVTLMHSDDEIQKLARAFGTIDQDFFLGLIHQLANAVSNGAKLDESEIKFLFAYVRNSRPRDETEAMLRAQMAACHVAAMRFANRLAYAEDVLERDCAQRAFTKLLRIFAGQAEVAQRYVNARDIVDQVVRQPIPIVDARQSAAEAASPVRAQAIPVVERGNRSPAERADQPRRAGMPSRRRASR